MKNLIQWLIFPVILVTWATDVMAQQAVLSGKITDAESGQPLRGATVQIIETKQGAYSDTKGEYRIKKLSNGSYTVRFSYVGYETKLVEKIAIQGQGEFTVTLDVMLSVTQKSANEIVVEAARINDNQAAILLQRQKAATVSDGISKEEISKLSDSDAGQALKRVTGVTLVEGKYVYVRGVSDRYSSTTLNGSTLTTTEPDKKSFAFDMFPSHLLENVGVIKSFTPDLPGNFVGGLVQMNTVDFPSEYSVKISTGIQGNDFVTLHTGQFVTYPGGSSDWLGLDGGWRAAPRRAADCGRLRPGVWRTARDWSGAVHGLHAGVPTAGSAAARGDDRRDCAGSPRNPERLAQADWSPPCEPPAGERGRRAGWA